MFNNSVFFIVLIHLIYTLTILIDNMKNLSKRILENAFLLLGHPGDFEIINDGKELASKV